MDEKEFRRTLELFPVVRSRDYCAEPGTSSRGTKQPLRVQEATKSNKKDSSSAEDLFMQKLKMAAEKKYIDHCQSKSKTRPCGLIVLSPTSADWSNEGRVLLQGI
ncbi:unnamed protein product [Urochloa decumbens]|uniref:Uncharacterized protein n=1 Tax=Urochloa decumbens TaxID=240449 RepID=A0ABC9EQL4_9POAL